MKSAEIKQHIINQIEQLDLSGLEEFYGIVLDFMNGKTESDEWLKMTDKQKDVILQAIAEIEDGKGISHESVVAEMRRKYRE